MRFKKLFVLLLSFILSFNFSSIALAKTPNTDELLRLKGIPEELIQIMPDIQKNEIISQNLVLNSIKKITLNENSEINDIKMQAQLSDTIPYDELSFYCTTYRSYTWSSTYKELIIFLNYDWAIIPDWTLTDTLGVAWDGNMWDPVPNSYYIQTSYDVREWPDVWNTYSIHNMNYSLANSSFTGAGWTTDIKYSWDLDTVYHNYGSSRIAIKAKNPSLTGSGLLAINYSHAMGIGSVGLNIGIISISYSGSANADTRGDYASFTY